MDRRNFVQSSFAAGAALAAAGTAAAHPAAASSPTPAPTPAGAPKFKLAYAPHFGMFKEHAGNDVVAQLEFMAGEGFTALEDNDMRGRSVAEQERIAAAMTRLKMTMGVFVAHTIDWSEPGLASGKPEKRDRFLKEVGESVDVAKRVNAKWMTVVPGVVDKRLDMDFQTANVVDSLRRAAAILEPHGLIMVIEMLNTRRDHAGQYLTHTAQAYQICRAVNSPSLKMLFDIYHMQITEGNLIPNISAAWDEIAYYQVGDNPGRNEPGTGEINYRNIFKHIHGKGFTGVVGMEHGNSKRGREGERAVIDAYVQADTW
ncbi:MAG: TIM barrel protein [Longimicrobiales bacterium]